jgi:hypothetical protein
LVPFWSTVLVAIPAWAFGTTVIDATNMLNNAAILVAFMLAKSWRSRWSVVFRNCNPRTSMVDRLKLRARKTPMKNAGIWSF